MRILALTNLYPTPLHPGRGPFNRLIFRFLAERAALRVVTPVAWTDYLSARWKQGVSFNPAQPRFQDGIPVVHPLYYYPPKGFRSWYGHCMYGSVRKTLERAANEFAPDLLYASWAYPDGWAAVRFARERGLPVVVSVLGSDVLTIPPGSPRHRRTMEGLSQADAVITVSRDLADKIIPYGVPRERVRVICTGVDPKVFNFEPPAVARMRLGLDAHEPIVLAIGNLVPVKGFNVLIDACAKLAEAREPFQCYLIGQGPLRGALERQIAALGLTERVHLLGARPQEQLPDWYRAANVVAISSHSEGVPNVQLEAAACGTPYVATRVGGIPEFAHVGWSRLVPPNNAAALAEGLREELRYPQQRMPPKPADVRSIVGVASDLLNLFERVVADAAQVYEPAGLIRRHEMVGATRRG